ncbi:MFS transporter [uncultured Thiodictyon sp.]|uniref:MFS transporter n=1 Tax=uncultured Thiodictyon sp. TaxID=1846217 RepID=UPI0025ECDA16|nr:MFS transporter [uncultured Thiodictyon sp.]
MSAGATRPMATRGVLGGFLVLNVVSGTVAGAMQLMVPLFALQLLATTAQIGMIRGISGLGLLLLVIPAGFLVDHFGARRLFLLGSLVGTVLTFAIPLSQIPLHLLALQGALGLFASLKSTALTSSFFSRIREMGIARAGWYKGSMSIGLSFLGPLLAAALTQALAPEQIFRLLAVMTLLPIALVFFFHEEARPAARQSGLTAGIRAQLSDLRALLANNPLVLPLLTEAAAGGCFAAFTAFIVPIVVLSLHLPGGFASVLTSLEGGAFILTVFLAGGLIRHLSPLQLYLLAVTVTLGALIGLGVPGEVFRVAAFSVVLGVGLGLFNLVTAMRQGLIKGEKGKAVSLFGASIGIGLCLGPLLGGQVGAHFYPSAAFIAFVPVFLALAALAVREARIHGPALALAFRGGPVGEAAEA